MDQRCLNIFELQIQTEREQTASDKGFEKRVFDINAYNEILFA
jgi:hypothetical protein